MVRATSTTATTRALTQDAAQTTAEPAVQIGVHGPVTMPKVTKPSLQRRLQRPGDPCQAVTVGAARFRPNRILELVQTLLAWQTQLAPKGVAQKVKAVRPRVHDLRLGRMQRQA